MHFFVDIMRSLLLSSNWYGIYFADNQGAMKRFLTFFICLFFVAGCSTSGKVVKNDNSHLNSTVTSYKIIEPTKAEPVKVVINEAGNKVEKKTEAVSKQVTAAPKNEQQTVEEEDDITLLLEPDDFQDFDIPIVFNDAVKYYVGYFTIEKKKVFGNWLKRARRYVPIIKEILKENGMPEDLVYLAMIESGFSPKAYSPKKASGPWQFIYSTGGRFGLRVNYWIDERRDPEKSTVAAAKYLRALFNQFGCWYLAAAGYNAGEGRVGKAIEKYNTNDFWELAKYNALPRETREYIPKLIAAAIIAKDPEKYGFGSITYDDPVRFEEVQMPKGTLLKVIAKANSMDLAYLKSLNPEILRGITPPNLNNYAIKLPSPVNIEDFHKNLEMALSSEKKVKDVTTYKVKKKDTLAKILKRYRLEQKDIYLVNDCEEGLKIKPGMVLNIPKFYGPSGKKEVVAKNVHRESTEVKPDKKEKQYKQAQQAKPEKQEQSRTYHIVKKGETLSTISNKYGIDVASLKIVNNLKKDKVYPNMKLKLVKHVQKKDKKDVKYHIVKKGETLSTISNKYGIDVASLKIVNNLKKDKVYPNMKLKIVKEEG